MGKLVTQDIEPLLDRRLEVTGRQQDDWTEYAPRHGHDGAIELDESNLASNIELTENGGHEQRPSSANHWPRTTRDPGEAHHSEDRRT